MKINTNFSIQYSKNNQKQHNKNVVKNNMTFTGTANSSYGKVLVYMNTLDRLKQESNIYPNDKRYREQLMANSGLNPKEEYKLRAIIGPDEIQDIMSEYDNKPEVFSTGINDENIRTGSIRANLHMHTTASDGSMTVQELLDKSAKYADHIKRQKPAIKEPFVIAITDHDTTESAKEAIKIISNDPLKYKNLRVILGVEMTTFNNIGTHIVNEPTNTHVLVYGIDPNEEQFSNFIDGLKQQKLQIEELSTQTANEIYKNHFNRTNFFSVSEAKQQYNTVDKNIIGIYNGMQKYFETKTMVAQIILQDDDIKQSLAKKHIPPETDTIMEKLSEYNNALNGRNKIQSGMDILPEFISTITGIDSEIVKTKLEQGLQTPEYQSYQNELTTSISKYKITLTPQYHYIPDFKTLSYNLTKQDNVILGIAHPIDTVKNIKDEPTKFGFLEDLFHKFSTYCGKKAKFFEAYYQSYKPERKVFNQSPKTQQFLEKISTMYKLFRTGSADTHGLNIYKR